MGWKLVRYANQREITRLLLATELFESAVRQRLLEAGIHGDNVQAVSTAVEAGLLREVDVSRWLRALRVRAGVLVDDDPTPTRAQVLEAAGDLGAMATAVAHRKTKIED